MNPEIKKRKYVIIAIILGMIMLTAPHFLRISQGNTNLIGDLPYYNLKLAESFEGPKDIFYEEDAYSKNTQIKDPYIMLLSLSGDQIELFSRLIPIVLGLLSLLLIVLILEKLNIRPIVRDTLLFMIIFSPIFIFTFSVSSKYSLVLFLFLAGFYLFTRKNTLNLIPSAIIFGSLPFFGMTEGIIAAASIIAYSLIRKEKTGWVITILSGMLITGFLHYSWLTSMLKPSVNPFFIEHGFLKNIISDFGGSIGLGIFKIILTVVGFIIVWREKKSNGWLIALLIGLVVWSFFDHEVIIYSSFLFGYFASMGVVSLIEEKWEVEYLKYLTLITIISGLLFSTVAYISTLSDSDPTQDQIESLQWMDKNLPKGKVLSHYKNGFWIEKVSGNEVLMNSHFDHNPDVNRYYNISEDIFHSRNLNKTLTLLKENDIDYIWIDEEMRNGLVWEREEEGLLFLFKNDKTFIRQYDSQYVQIYQINYEESV